ncbi:MAG: DJ-1/PfpI family protein [Clostridia bacterium]|nr:DJ-1/PfpI family protein [Clostridia bacterium]
MVYVLLADGFEEIEALAPVDFLRRCGVKVTTVSVSEPSVFGAHGIRVIADKVLSDIDFSDGEMIVLPGGMPGTTNLDNFPQMTEILASVYDRGGYLAAICAAPSVLGTRGYLKGKEAICYPGFEELLSEATLSEKGVVRDGRIITAKSAGFAWQFGKVLAEVFVDQEVCERTWQNLFLHLVEKDV